jgi:hypothetical protein
MSKHSPVLTAAEICSIQIGERYFWSVDGERVMTLSRPSYFPIANAQQLQRTLKKRGYSASLIPEPPTNGAFWLRGNSLHVVKYTLMQAPIVDFRDSCVPPWFVDAMKTLDAGSWCWKHAEKGDYGIGEMAMQVFHEHFHRSLDWMDHSGWSTKSDGQVVFVSEPYGLDAEKLQHLMNVVNACDFALNISATSHHYPGRTLRIEISPKAK